MPILAAILLGVGIFFMSRNASNAGRLYGLLDVLPEEQGGSYKRDFDVIFEKYADKYGVPFALLKAHAIKESSLNPRAFRDENPTKRVDRQGWASRGLMQLLAWPGTTRWVQFGYPVANESDLEKMYDPEINIDLAAQLIRSNLKACGGNLRDAINMYNAGVKESVRQAPGEYVNKVVSYYEKMIKRSV